MGDPCGIGPEVIVKALADPDIRALGRFIVYGIDDVLVAAADAASLRPYWFTLPVAEALRIDSGVVTVDFAEFAAGFFVRPRVTREGGRASLRFVDVAIEAARTRQVDAIVTGPIHKSSWHLAGCRFPGHTEKLAEACGVKRVTMAFVGGGLRLALVSTHLGLLEFCNRFNLGKVFQTLEHFHTALVNWFGIEHPRIAVAGLNPHAGENGRFGDEEKRVIEPAMQMARHSGIDVAGPFPADTLFTPRSRSRFDGFVAMYHDQGLIPLKMLAFDTAVNITLGLPIIRTSPDHGTAFDIAGTSQADPGSMKEAIRLACQLATADLLTRNTQDPQPAPTFPLTVGNE